jgi:hypothetical protein
MPFSNQGKGISIRALLDLGLTIKLFVNNHTIGNGTTEANLTEASFSGYVDVDFPDSDSWTVTPGAPTVAVAAQQSFQADAVIDPPQTVYGFCLVLTATGEFVCGENITPFTIAAFGSFVKVTPRLRYRNPGE